MRRQATIWVAIPCLTVVGLQAPSVASDREGEVVPPVRAAATSAAPASAVASLDIPATTLIKSSFRGDSRSMTATSSKLAGLPSTGSSSLILSTGLASQVAGGSPGEDASSRLPGAPRGTDGNDLTQLRLDLRVPAGATCLVFDFAFGSDEFPEYVGSKYNDVFTAELGSSKLRLEGGSVKSANNFAFDPKGGPIEINSVFGLKQIAGTRLDGFTDRLTARAAVKGGTSTAVIFSIQDIGDSILDSAVLIDSLRWRAGKNCDEGAITGTRYVAMGDSYSSGEGVGPYVAPSNSVDNKCHRSTSAYSYLVEQQSKRPIDSPVFVACSGAVTSDLISPNHSKNIGPGGVPEPAQLSALDSETALVTLTIGGNDLGFGSILGKCLWPIPSTAQRCTKAEAAAKFGDRLKALRGESSSVVRSDAGTPIVSWPHILREIHKRAPSATIVLAGYPFLVNPAGAGFVFENSQSCFVGNFSFAGDNPLFISKTDALWIITRTFEVNKAMKAVAQQFPYVKFVDVQPSKFIGHIQCDDDPWLNGVVPGGGELFSPASFHPTSRGQRAYADAVVDAIN